MTIGRHPKRIWLRGALALVLALLVHDVLMASGARTAPMAATVATAQKHESAHPGIAVTPGHHTHGPSPAHPSECGTTGSAVSTSSYQLDFSDAGVPATLVQSDCSALTPATMHNWSKPHSSPGMRRALFQVYRI